jgi:hypothetical protein
MTKILLSELFKLGFFYSISFRSPNQLPSPFDYENRVGFYSKSFSTEYLWERENGGFYYGRENKGIIKAKDVIWNKMKLGTIEFGFRDFVRTARNINNQECFTQFVIENKNLNVGLGYSYLWEDNLKHPVNCLRTVLNFHKVLDFNFSLTTNFWDRSLWDIYLGKEFAFNPFGFNIFSFKFVNFAKYNLKGEKRIPENEYWQIKSLLELDFDLEKIMVPKWQKKRNIQPFKINTDSLEIKTDKVDSVKIKLDSLMNELNKKIDSTNINLNRFFEKIDSLLEGR